MRLVCAALVVSSRLWRRLVSPNCEKDTPRAQAGSFAKKVAERSRLAIQPRCISDGGHGFPRLRPCSSGRATEPSGSLRNTTVIVVLIVRLTATPPGGVPPHGQASVAITCTGAPREPGSQTWRPAEKCSSHSLSRSIGIAHQAQWLIMCAQ